MSTSDVLKVIVFRVGKEEYCITTDQVLSIERVQSINHVPKMSSHIKGVINLRDSVIPIVDLRTYLLEKEVEDNEENRIVIVQVDGIKIGLFVDEATDVIDIPTDKIEPISGVESDSSMQVAKLDQRLVILLDIKHLLTESDSKLFEKIKQAV
jgi:purine-binding chemotaxis protein CheW